MGGNTDIKVRQAVVADLDMLAPLFDAYRMFYAQPSNMVLARAFLLERFQRNQSVLFLALRNDGAAVGFTQLYPSFSSVSAAPIFILNDLFVVPEARRRGVGARLLSAAAEYGRSHGAVKLSLTTGVSNAAAQALYAAQGWVREDDFYAYNLSL